MWCRWAWCGCLRKKLFFYTSISFVFILVRRIFVHRRPMLWMRTVIVHRFYTRSFRTFLWQNTLVPVYACTSTARLDLWSKMKKNCIHFLTVSAIRSNQVCNGFRAVHQFCFCLISHPWVQAMLVDLYFAKESLGSLPVCGFKANQTWPFFLQGPGPLVLAHFGPIFGSM